MRVHYRRLARNTRVLLCALGLHEGPVHAPEGGPTRWRQRGLVGLQSGQGHRPCQVDVAGSAPLPGPVVATAAHAVRGKHALRTISPCRVTFRPILLQRIWITPSGHEFTKLGRSMYQRLSLADVGVCMHA